MTEAKRISEIRKKPVSETTNLLQLKERELARKVEGQREAQIKLSEMQSWIKEINPNFNPFMPLDPYSNNCGTCAFVVHNRLKGNKDIVAGRINIAPMERDMEELTGLECVHMSPAEIEKLLISRGPGSELIMGIVWRDGPGHWLNVFYDGQKIYTVDGQCGEITDWATFCKRVSNRVSDWCTLV